MAPIEPTMCDYRLRGGRGAEPRACQTYLSPQVTRFMLDMILHADVARGQAAAARLAKLPPRESKIMSLLAQGLPNGSIAGRRRMRGSGSPVWPTSMPHIP